MKSHKKERNRYNERGRWIKIQRKKERCKEMERKKGIEVGGDKKKSLQEK